MSPAITIIGAAFLFGSRFGVLRGKNMVTQANIESIRDEMEGDRKNVNRQDKEVRAVVDRLTEVEKKTHLIEYIATETKDLVADVNRRLAKIDVEIAKLAIDYSRDRDRDRDRGRSPI